MDNSGNFYLNGTNGYLQWNRSSDTLGIKGDMYLYYLDTKKYWDTKANIRNNILKRLGI